MENCVTGKVLEFLFFFLLLLLQQQCSSLQVTLPPFQSSLIGRDVLLPCTFRVDNPPVNPKFLALLWHFGDKEVLRYDNKGKVSSPRLFIDEKLILEGNVSLSLSNVTISDRGTYRCSVIYSPNTQQKEIRLHIHAVPEVGLAKRSVSKNQRAFLQCSITGFYPEPINVTWLRNGKLLPNSVLGPLQQNEDGMFQQDSTLTLTPSFTRGNPIYACQVQHESLPTPRQDSYKVQYGVQPGLTQEIHEDLQLQDCGEYWQTEG
ncbi:CD276 antigen-like isoform X2 [Xenopus laevis]|uniref:CD276 antigen-like isoform X2 n=1 Tax=Xenopus laevis TaxID=8355 RepID=A0A8J1LRF9_XENLA|nr:CD276 antigen-like isoform X2 [Xenopus laevis]